MYAKVVRQLIRRWQERERKQARVLVLALVLRTERQGPDSFDLEKEELDRRTDKMLSCYNTFAGTPNMLAYFLGHGRPALAASACLYFLL